MMATPRRSLLIRVLAVLTVLSILFFISLTQQLVPLARQRENDIPASVQDTIQSTNTSTSLPRILIVSALYPLAKSKHSMDDYKSWLLRFLEPITTDIYFYTTPDLAPLVRRVRGDLPITINTTFPSPFDIPPLNGLQEQYKAMHAIDREKFRHSPELYAVWNAKPYFLDAAVKHSGKEYDYAFWNDAGSFRSDHEYTQWPDPARVEEIWEVGSLVSRTEKEDLLFYPIYDVPSWRWRFWTEKKGPVDSEVSEGSFFGGSPKTIEWWQHTFYTYHDHYLSLGFFVGKDQTIINALFFLFPSRIITVWLDDPLAPAHLGLLPFIDGSLGNCGAEWYYYQWWMAGADVRERMCDIFDREKGWSWSWWKKRQRCRLTRVLSMKRVLERQFGVGWKVSGGRLIDK